MKTLSIIAALTFTISLHAADKAKQMNMYDFGGRGNGTFDDTLAFQKAAAFFSTIGGSLLIPEGTWNINTTVVFTNKVNITGDGMWVTKVVWTGAVNAGPMFQLGLPGTFTSDWGLRGLSFYGSKLCAEGIVLNGMTRGIVEGCYFQDFTSAHVHTYDAVLAGFRDVRFGDMPSTNAYGVLLDSASTGASGYVVDHCNFDTGLGNGVKLVKASNGLLFTASTFENCNIGIEIPKNSFQGAVTIDSCFFETVTKPLAIGESGASTPPGPITVKGSAFAQSMSLEFNGDVKQLIFDGNSVNCTNVVFGAGILDLWARGNSYGFGRTISAVHSTTQDEASEIKLDGASIVGSGTTVVMTNRVAINTPGAVTAFDVGGDGPGLATFIRTNGVGLSIQSVAAGPLLATYGAHDLHVWSDTTEIWRYFASLFTTIINGSLNVVTAGNTNGTPLIVKNGMIKTNAGSMVSAKVASADTPSLDGVIQLMTDGNTPWFQIFGYDNSAGYLRTVIPGGGLTVGGGGTLLFEGAAQFLPFGTGLKLRDSTDATDADLSARDLTLSGTLSAPLLSLAVLNTDYLNVLTNMTFSTTNSVPSNTNAVLWLPVVVGGVTGSIPWMANP